MINKKLTVRTIRAVSFYDESAYVSLRFKCTRIRNITFVGSYHLFSVKTIVHIMQTISIFIKTNAYGYKLYN